MRNAPLFVSLALLCAAGCSSDDGDDDTGGQGSAASGNGNGTAASGGAAGSGSDNGNGVGGSGAGFAIGVGGSAADANGSGGSGARAGNGTPEVCDGVDNDDNGIIDDVDAGNDGVCDCLNIATIGQIGPWSSGGNIFASWLDARSPQGAVPLDDEELTDEMLAPHQVIVVLHAATSAVTGDDRTAAAHHPFSDAEAAAFKGWVEAGGGVMTTIGYTGDEASEVENVNKLLHPIGMGYSPTKLSLTGFITNWESHPVTMGVENIFTDNGVEPSSESGMTVARGSEDRIALQVRQAGNGRAVVWGDEWITYDSEWQDLDMQQVELFWLNILKWLSPPNECQVPIPPSVVE